MIYAIVDQQRFVVVQMGAMCDVSATETAIIYGLEPVWGAAFAWFLLGERWGTTGWVGAALVLGKMTSKIPFHLRRLEN